MEKNKHKRSDNVDTDRVFTHARLYYSANVYVDIYPKKEKSGLPKISAGGDAQ